MNPESGPAGDLDVERAASYLDEDFDNKIVPLLSGKTILIDGESKKITEMARILWQRRGNDATYFTGRLQSLIEDLDAHLAASVVPGNMREALLHSLRKLYDDCKTPPSINKAAESEQKHPVEPIDRFMP